MVWAQDSEQVSQEAGGGYGENFVVDSGETQSFHLKLL